MGWQQELYWPCEYHINANSCATPLDFIWIVSLSFFSLFFDLFVFCFWLCYKLATLRIQIKCNDSWLAPLRWNAWSQSRLWITGTFSWKRTPDSWSLLSKTASFVSINTDRGHLQFSTHSPTRQFTINALKPVCWMSPNIAIIYRLPFASIQQWSDEWDGGDGKPGSKDEWTHQMELFMQTVVNAVRCSVLLSSENPLLPEVQCFIRKFLMDK